MQSLISEWSQVLQAFLKNNTEISLSEIRDLYAVVSQLKERAETRESAEIRRFKAVLGIASDRDLEKMEALITERKAGRYHP